MFTYIGIFSGMQALGIRCALLAALLSVPATAQNARIHRGGAQPNLRIHVIVVPAIGADHRDKDRDRDRDRDKDVNRKGDDIFYNLNPRHEEFSITNEMRSMLVDSGNNTFRQEQVQAITIVPK
jgi:hypothetical protein